MLDWYAAPPATCRGARPDAGPWAVLVSEVMLQQTPVARVLPAYAAWLERWPTPADLAAEPPGEAVRMWGRLGYPRRALRLHACAVALIADARRRRCRPTSTRCSPCPASALHRPGRRLVRLRAAARRGRHQRAPGAGPRGARPGRGRAAVDGPRPRRGRGAAAGRAGDGGPLRRRADGTRRAGLHRPRAALRRLPARRPVRLARGRPPGLRPARRAAPQRFAGTDRQVRGLLLDVLRADAGARCAKAQLDAVWADAGAARARPGRLVATVWSTRADGRYALPG